MNKKTVLILLLFALIILAGAPTSFAKNSYLNNLTEVYNNGSCGTCHNNSEGGPRTSYGLLFENQSNHNTNASAALKAIGASSKSNATTPTAAMTATSTEPVTTEITDETPKEDASSEDMDIPEDEETTPGFGFVAAFVGLFAWALLTKRNNK